jgi:hypothetical protein
VVAYEVPQPAAYPVSYDRVADNTADDEADQGWGIVVISPEQVNHDMRPSSAASAPDGQRELSTPPHPIPGRQHENYPFRPRREPGPCGAAPR